MLAPLDERTPMKTRALPLAFAVLLALPACKGGVGGGKAPTLNTEEQKTLYALGLMLGRNIAPFALTPEEVEIVQAGLRDSVTGVKPQVALDTYGPKIQNLARTRGNAKSE